MFHNYRTLSLNSVTILKMLTFSYNQEQNCSAKLSKPIKLHYHIHTWI
jgi:hypothetical protein